MNQEPLGKVTGDGLIVSNAMKETRRQHTNTIMDIIISIGTLLDHKGKKEGNSKVYTDVEHNLTLRSDKDPLVSYKVTLKDRVIFHAVCGDDDPMTIRTYTLVQGEWQALLERSALAISINKKFSAMVHELTNDPKETDGKKKNRTTKKRATKSNSRRKKTD